MRAKVNESPGIKSKTDDVAEAVAAVKRALIDGLGCPVGGRGHPRHQPGLHVGDPPLAAVRLDQADDSDVVAAEMEQVHEQPRQAGGLVGVKQPAVASRYSMLDRQAEVCILNARIIPGISSYHLDRSMSDQQLLERITCDPGVMVGKPVIKGTRLTVEFILNHLAHGSAPGDILAEYDGLAAEDIQACLLFASHALSDSAFMPLVTESA